MGSLSSFNHSVNYLLCVIHVFTSNALENKRTKTVLHGFIEIVNESKSKPYKLWVDQGKKIYNSFVQKWLDNECTLLTMNVKSVAVQMFIRTFKNKIHKKMTEMKNLNKKL